MAQKEYSVEFARNERNAYSGTIKAASIKQAIAKIKEHGVEALKDYEEDAIIDILEDDSFTIVGEWKPSGGKSSSLHRFKKEIKIEDEIEAKPVGKKFNAIYWFNHLTIVQKIKIAERYTAETSDNTNIAEGLNQEAEEWLLKNFKGLPIFTVEELFDVDQEECDEQVIRLNDLSEDQRKYLGITV